MENHGFYVPSQFCTRRHYEHRSWHWITILCVFDFYFKQNCWRLCVIWSIPCSGNGTFELARHPLQVIKCFNVNLKDYTIQYFLTSYMFNSLFLSRNYFQFQSNSRCVCWHGKYVRAHGWACWGQRCTQCFTFNGNERKDWLSKRFVLLFRGSAHIERPQFHYKPRTDFCHSKYFNAIRSPYRII